MIKWNDINEIEPEVNRNILAKFNKAYLDTIPKEWNMPFCYVVCKTSYGTYTEAAGDYSGWNKKDIEAWIYLEDLENMPVSFNG